MKYPQFLKENGTIGFVAPAFGCSSEPYRSAFDNSLSMWKDKGYYVNLGENVYVDCGIGISNSPDKCAEELVDSYVNSDVDALISCGGGELMCEILPYVDFDAIMSAKPKWYMGYSDNTNATFMLTTKCDVASLYGPNAPTFGMQPWHPSIQKAFEIITGRAVQNGIIEVSSFDKYEIESLKSEENPLAPYNCTENVEIRAFVPDDGVMSTNLIATTNGVMLTKTTAFSGRIIGGCLDCLVSLVGTRFDYVDQFIDRYSKDGIIWYLEACDLNIFGVRRALWQMQEAGWFKNVKGFIFGRPINGENMYNLNRFDAVLPIACVKNGVPVIMDADIGHRPPQMIMINGALGNVSYDNGLLKIAYSFAE